MKVKKSVVLAALAAVMMAGLPATAQVSEEIEVSILEIPVNVVDNSGDPVRGLEQAQFEVTIDGKAVPIRYFDVIDLAEPAPVKEEFVPMHPAARRKFLLLFDLSASSPDNLIRATEAASVFVDEVMQPQDLTAVATFSLQSGTRLLTGFTRSKGALQLAIRTLGNPDFFRVQDPLMLTAGVTSAEISAAPVEIQPGEGGPGSGGGAGGVGRAGAAAIAAQAAADYARMNVRVSNEHRKNSLRAQFQNLASVGRLLDSVRGQKQVLFFSEGFDPSLITGSGTSARGAEQSARGQIWELDSDEIYGSSGVAQELEQMAEVFNRSDVVLHAIDIEGIRMNAGRSNFTSGTDESLYLLATPTGGTVFKNTNHLEETLIAASRQHEVVYVLAVTPPAGGEPNQWRDIDVSVDRRGAKVIHKQGYYVKTGQQDPFEMFTGLTERLTGAGGYNPFDVYITGIPLPAERGVDVQIVVELDGDDLLRESHGNAVQADVFVYAFTPQGDVAGFFHQEVALDAAKASKSFGEKGVRIYGNLNLRPGTYDVRTLVRSKATGQAGVERATVVVPENPSVTDPLFFAEQADWVMVRNTSAQGDTYPFIIGDQSFVPMSTITTGKSPLQFALFTWGLQPDQLALDLSVMDQGGNRERVPVQLVGRTAPDESGLMKLLLQMDPSGLAPGDYTVRVGIKDASGNPQWGSGRLIVQ